MIDPISTSQLRLIAFNLIKKGFSVGRDVESMGKDLGRWMGAMSDSKKAHEYTQKPPLFKKYFKQALLRKGNHDGVHGEEENRGYA